ncbi:cytochrome c heme lyase, putative [Plasmodium malariae]|uniref:Holocytochrome c-type synthase n=1 Tax=Plasmodium malariae TaxID=5858 RepID=A0A1D3TF07_PLAMA|nr:cytochrome c heme lyase, putative [Plasmodium malariae]SCP03529.1 cytochrome c heme lyase, putative [Plasmodium malariae]
MQNISVASVVDKNDEREKCPAKLKKSGDLTILESEINESNMMPEIPNYALKGNCDLSLNKKRDVSSIPKNNKEYWLYPSPQQFYNSLLRKNKDIDINYIDAVVNVHNEVNEESWKHILKYEHMHKKKCSHVTLQRFLGKFDDLTFKAKFRSFFSRLGRPFDRHDWYINRCGTEVKYILDYYNDETINDDKNIYIDVRPAMDSFSNIWDRVRYPFYEFYFKYIKKYELFR